MGFLDLFKRPDINREVGECGSVPGAVLVDVRSRQEYLEGYIPGSRNVPLQDIAGAAGELGPKDTPLFLDCFSGARSGQAAGALRGMGYTNVKNIGGIAAWRGAVER